MIIVHLLLGEITYLRNHSHKTDITSEVKNDKEMDNFSKLPPHVKVIKFLVDNFQGTGKRQPWKDLSLSPEVKNQHIRLITIGVS